jgi:hypothetical protein
MAFAVLLALEAVRGTGIVSPLKIKTSPSMSKVQGLLATRRGNRTPPGQVP